MRTLLGIGVVVAVWLTLLGAAEPAFSQDTPSAKKTRGRLKEKVSIEVKDTRVKDVFDEIKREMNNKVSFKIDNVSGVSNNSKLTYKGEDKTLAQMLDEICTLNDMGYVIISKAGDRYDGWILIRKGKGKERGYEAGKEPGEKSSALQRLHEPPAVDMASARSEVMFRAPVAVAATRD
jgi:hypothetical protein